MQSTAAVTIDKDTRKNWQEIVDILASIINIPAALIMQLHKDDIEVFISSDSTNNPYHPGDKEHFENSGLYCETAIKTNNKLLVPDALSDEDWKDNPDIKLNMISYLGFPIHLPDKQAFGTLCVLDNKPNSYSLDIEKLMQNFIKIIESHIEMLYVNQVLGDENKKLTDYLTEIQTFRDLNSICSYCKSIKDKNGDWHPVEHWLINHPKARFSHGVCPDCIERHHPEIKSKSK